MPRKRTTASQNHTGSSTERVRSSPMSAMPWAVMNRPTFVVDIASGGGTHAGSLIDGRSLRKFGRQRPIDVAAWRRSSADLGGESIVQQVLFSAPPRARVLAVRRRGISF